MRFKFHFIFLVICLCFTACGEERINGVLDDILVPPTDVQTELPPAVWEAVLQRPVPRIELEAYYNRYIDAGGIAIIGNESVADKYFLSCYKAVMILTSKHPYLRDILQPPFYMVIYPQNVGEDYFLDMPPEIIKLHEKPNSRHVFLAGYCGGPYCYASLTRPETHAKPPIDTFVHEFAHKLHTAITHFDAEFGHTLMKAYTTAIEAGTWKGAYAEENASEYWAEGVVFWFARIGAVDWHRHRRVFALESYEEFAAHDPLLFELLDEWLPRYSLALYDFENSYLR